MNPHLNEYIKKVTGIEAKKYEQADYALFYIIFALIVLAIVRLMQESFDEDGSLLLFMIITFVVPGVSLWLG